MRDRLLRRLLQPAEPTAAISTTGARSASVVSEPAPVGLAIVAEPSAPARVNLTVASPPARVPEAGARVLVVTADRRFRQMAATLLSQRGHDVILPRGDEDVAALARREHAEAVVIDASASLTAAARQVARLRCLRPRVGVVAVGAESGSSLAALPVLPKWSSFDEVLAAVDHAYADARTLRGDA
jgi:CheY-like chemotaxis protein